MNTVHDPLSARSIDSGAEEGFGLIEIIISMFLLAMLAVMLAPVLIQGLKQSASNATLASATQLANEQSEQARAWKSCDDVVASIETVTDARAVELTIETTVGPCAPAAEDPVAVPVTVVVTRSDLGLVVTTTKTLVFIEFVAVP